MRADATLVLPWPYSGLLAGAAVARANQQGGVLSNKIVDAKWLSVKANLWQSDHHLPTPIGHWAGLVVPEDPSFPAVKCDAPHAVFLAMGQGT